MNPQTRDAQTLEEELHTSACPVCGGRWIRLTKTHERGYCTDCDTRGHLAARTVNRHTLPRSLQRLAATAELRRPGVHPVSPPTRTVNECEQIQGRGSAAT